jgi:hypothetical protein
MVFQLPQTLNPSVLEVALLIRIEFSPFFVFELVVEINNEKRMNKVQKGIANIGFILEINGQIQKVISL